MPNNKGARMERDLVLSQADFDRFARISGDHNPIHVDPDYAASTRFGATVSHGMLLFSTVCGLINEFFPDARLDVQDLKFPAPAYADEPLMVVLETKSQPVDGIVHLTTEVLKKDGNRCLQGTCRLKLSQEVA
ncbi:MaoC family dehydratase [Marinobacter sp. SS8-8]|uniref:MaoC family dehydratase n=1 Tax=Marinobacter sp. SS8-8 TaxID=3050452 RepID=UPI0026DEE062|nr:MaoC family dehydratase [Marinobacter sp. SS8-8]